MQPDWPAVDKVDELLGEAMVLGVFQEGWVSLHHLGQLVKYTVPLGVRETTGRYLNLKEHKRWNH